MPGSGAAPSILHAYRIRTLACVTRLIVCRAVRSRVTSDYGPSLDGVITRLVTDDIRLPAAAPARRQIAQLV
jgi:hypothetical protein